MSIHDLINDAVNRGRLFYLPPKYSIYAVKRSIFITQEIKDLLEGYEADHQWKIRGEELRADLDKFTCGRPIVATFAPKRERSVLWKRLLKSSEEIWEVRSHSEPALRVFGRFAEKDSFIAVTWALREHLDEDSEWNRCKQIVKCEWRNLFFANEPFSGDHPNDYISNARSI
jgi:hypothetical protein